VFVIRWVFDDQGRVIGVGLGSKSNTPAVVGSLLTDL
jgi:hypothetical protein